MSEENGADVDLKVAGQEFRFKNIKSINTILTTLGFVGTCLLMYGGWIHVLDARDRDKDQAVRDSAFVSAVKEQTVAIREGTAVTREQVCLLRFDQTERRANAEFCKQVSGSR